MGWLKLESKEHKALSAELTDLLRRLEGLSGRLEKLEQAHLSLRGKVYRQKGWDEDGKPEDSKTPFTPGFI